MEKEDYTPFGDLWKKEMKKFNKDQLIDFLRTALIQNLNLQQRISTANLKTK